MISIIILSYRNPALLRLCLKSLSDAVSHPDEYEVIVVDNDTTPETRAVVQEEFADILPVRLVPLRENAGYTRGVNEGMRVARGQYILALNYDIVMVPGTMHALAAYLREHPEVGLIGPRLINFDDTPQDSCFRFYTPLTVVHRRMASMPWTRKHLRHFAMHDTDISSVCTVDWVSGAAFMTTRQALERVGCMDEQLFHYFSDVDWAWRFWENGYTVVYYPMAGMYHYHGRTSKGRLGILDPLFNRVTRWHIKDALTYFRKHGISGHRPGPGDRRQPHLDIS